MKSFYPGPSKLYHEIAGLMQKACEEGVLSINHRSKEFIALSKSTIQLLKEKLNIPTDYSVFYTSSATECWEIISQSLVRKQSFHIYNGAFGEKWHEYSRKINLDSRGLAFDLEGTPEVQGLKLFKETEMLCLTQNETSNGTQVSHEIIEAYQQRFPELLLAIDATSSLGGTELNIAGADIWFASVQKCFGLPAGMALLICSPKAMKRAAQINDKRRYNSLLLMQEKMKDWQTTHTPNVLNIYLLKNILEKIHTINKISDATHQKAKTWYSFFEGRKNMSPLVKNTNLRSDTVICVQGQDSFIASLKDAAKNEGYLLGNGYGKWAKNTFRIANFPAITEEDIRSLQEFLINNE
jgi:phosphoserine aminotransferase